MPVSGSNSNYTITGNSPADIGYQLITRDYLIDVYPNLIGTFKQAGLWGWGSNTYGGLGDNTSTQKSSPVQTVSGGTNWKLVSGGYDHTAAIKTDGTLWLWGRNKNGALGTNAATVGPSSPVQTVSTGTNWKLVSCGNYSTSSIKTDGTLWLWGSNAFGELGDNSRTHRSSPVQTVAGGTNWKQVSMGGDFGSGHAAAIKTDGTLWLWGFSTQGQLGNNATTHRSSPVQTVSTGTNWKLVNCGSYNTAAIKTDGTLWLWGHNTQGQLGDDTTTHRSSPVQTVAQGTNWKQVSIGLNHTTAIKTDGTLWTWGLNTSGQLGDNTTVNKSSPVQTVAGGTNWKINSCKSLHSTAIKTDGTLWTWGFNFWGQLGDNTVTNRSSPIQTVSTGTNWKLVDCGNYRIGAIRDDSADIFGYPT